MPRSALFFNAVDQHQNSFRVYIHPSGTTTRKELTTKKLEDCQYRLLLVSGEEVFRDDWRVYHTKITQLKLTSSDHRAL